MPEVDDLIRAYGRFVSIPWRGDLPGAQRVWMAVYQPTQERRIRNRIPEFELETTKAGHTWRLHDLTEAFPTWLKAQEYAEAYYEDPAALSITLGEFVEAVVDDVKASLAESDEGEVVGLLGAGALYPFARLSHVIERVNGWVPGRLLVFFPGSYANNVYRLLNARDGWNYMAVPITAAEGEST